MKILCLVIFLLSLVSSAASAGDFEFETSKAGLKSTAPWSGFYAGLNAGYGFGVNGIVSGQSVSTGHNSINQLISPQTLIDGYVIEVPTSYTNHYSPAALGFIQTFSSLINMDGFQGGGQAGYNFQRDQIILGVEADIQGTTMNGTQTAQQAGGNGTSSTASGMWSVPGQGAIDTYNSSIDNTGLFYRKQRLNAGLSWIGTLRSRVGFLIQPDLLVYTTGGLAYGNVFANFSSSGFISNSFSGNITRYTNFNLIDGVYPSSGQAGVQTIWGNQNQSSTRVGWTVGGGFEKSFIEGWSLKTEAIYYTLGSMKSYDQTYISGATASTATGLPTVYPSPNIIYNQALINYSGVLLRLGLNRHFAF